MIKRMIIGILFLCSAATVYAALLAAGPEETAQQESSKKKEKSTQPNIFTRFMMCAFCEDPAAPRPPGISSRIHCGWSKPQQRARFAQWLGGMSVLGGISTMAGCQMSTVCSSSWEGALAILIGGACWKEVTRLMGYNDWVDDLRDCYLSVGSATTVELFADVERRLRDLKRKVEGLSPATRVCPWANIQREALLAQCTNVLNGVEGSKNVVRELNTKACAVPADPTEDGKSPKSDGHRSSFASSSGDLDLPDQQSEEGLRERFK